LNFQGAHKYLQRCGVDNNSIIGMSGDCGDLRENHYLVADFTVEASGVGDVTLTFDGTGEVMIVQSGMGGALGSIVLLCLGCCLSPVLIIVSGVKLAKGEGQNVILVNGGQFVNQQPVFQQPVSQQPPQAHNFSTAPVQQGYQDSSQTSEKEFSSWDSSPTVSDKPPGYQKPTHSSGGYEWLEHNGKM